jgi:DNA-directed RNA polymerase subunit delta
MDKKRVIVDYKNITQALLQRFTDTFPRGYDDDDIIRFKNAKGEWVFAVPMETEDTKYLVKISVELDRKVEAFLDDDDDDGVKEDISIDESELDDDDRE